MTDNAGIEDDGSGEAAARARAQAALSRLPPRLQRWLVWLLSRWPRRVVIRGVRAFIRLDVFDRSMTIAAQFFTSVFPLLILFTTWASSRDTHWLTDALSMPEQTRSVVEDATQGAGGAAFGIVGAVIVLGSATSLSRALTRAFAAVWGLPRPKSRLGSAWRWLAVVLLLTLSPILVRAASEPVHVLPPRELLPLLASFVLPATVSLLVPSVLLAGAVQLRLLAPGALLFALLMVAVRPATAAWLPHALEVSDARYGPIGVAFTYLGCLYAASFCFMTTAVIGQVIATDRGWFGQWIRGTEPAEDANGARDDQDDERVS